MEICCFIYKMLVLINIYEVSLQILFDGNHKYKNINRLTKSSNLSGTVPVLEPLSADISYQYLCMYVCITPKAYWVLLDECN